MLGCDGCQDRMLEHLYDALEEVAQRAFLDHLAGCPACQAALEQARASKSLFARAARLHFPDVTFTPPADEPLPGTGPVVLPSRPLARPRRTWPRLAIAAAVLLAVGALGVLGYRGYDEYQSAARAVLEHHDAVAAARAELARAQDEGREA